MKTITPLELQRLIDKGDVELIDVRPKRDFEKVHALVAHSVPLSEFEPHAVIAHRHLDGHAPLYIMARDKAPASLVACGLASAGLAEPIIVEGGIDAWDEQLLPTKRKQSFRLPQLNFWHAMAFFGFACAASLFFDGLRLAAGVLAFAVAAAVLEFRAAQQPERPTKCPGRWRSRLAGFPLMERPPL
jgi:rhodanese-related sulfurtransferase